MTTKMTDRIVIRWEPSTEGGSETFTFGDLGVNNAKEWEELGDDERDQRMREALDGLPERVWAVPVRWTCN